MKPIKTYKEKRWVELRRSILARDKHLDKYLFRYGKFVSADMVHHIFPVKDFPEYQYEPWNLISVSKSTHSLFHDRVTDELTDVGKQLLVSTARKNNIEIPTWYLREKRKKGKKYDYRY